MNKIEMVKELLASEITCRELREAAEKYLGSIGTEKEKECAGILIAEAQEDIMPLENVSAFFASDFARDHFGEEFAEENYNHCQELLSRGETKCDCPACTAARHIVENRELF